MSRWLRWRKHLLLAILATFCCSVAMLAGCGAWPGSTTSSADPIAFLTFTAATDYTAAISIINDVGLRHTLPCRGDVEYSQGATGRWTQWWSLDDQRNYTGDTSDPHALWVISTVLAPPDWASRIGAAPGVTPVQTDNFAYTCGQHLADAQPTPGVNYYLPNNQIGGYARVSFTTTAIYAQVLAAANDLGLRLADPCREQRIQAGNAGAWQTAGQETAFAQTHSLVVATTYDSSDHWRQQLMAIPGATAVQAPYTPTCS